MIHAYNEIYLEDAQNFLGDLFDYAINQCGCDADYFAIVMSTVKPIKEFEIGNPNIISGKSGIEIAQDILKIINENLKPQEISFGKSREFWAGWSLAYYQWYSNKSFKNIFELVPFSEIVQMYNPYHEMDISTFVEELDNRYNKFVPITNLRKIREARGLSQNELANYADVSFRCIQLYEQRQNDIDKAQAQTLFRIARVLGCSIEDLLENPEQRK